MAMSRRLGARLLPLAALAALLGPLSCGSQQARIEGPGAEGEFLEGRAAYDRGDQMRAIELLEAFERNHPGSQFIDDALYYLGLAHQANNEQLLARQAFQRLLDAFPRSSYAEDARFQFAQSWLMSMRGPALDPEPAEEALRAYAAYLRRYPDGEFREEAQEGMRRARSTLAEKDCLNGRTYLRLGKPEPARRYFRKSLERWDQAPVSAKALAGIARTYEEEKNWPEARRAWEALVDHLVDDPGRYEDGEELADKARERLASLPR